MTKYANLTNDQCEIIEKQVMDLGLIELGDDLPTKIVTCDKVLCPICSGSLEVYTSGKSFQISCGKDGRISVFRGFSNPSYFKE